MRNLPRLIVLLLAPTSLLAQATLCPNYQDLINKLRAATDDAARNRAAGQLTKIGLTEGCFVDYVVSSHIEKLKANAADRIASPAWLANLNQRLEALRTDKQSGATAGTSGSTSVISRGASAKAFSLAAEYGAMTQSVQGQVVTFAGNLAGIPTVLAQKSVLPYCDPRRMLDLKPGEKPPPCIEDVVLRTLRRVSFSASFDASRNAQTVTGTPATTTTTGATTGTSSGTAASSAAAVPVTFAASGKELSAFTARVELLNRRDTTSKDFLTNWAKQVQDAKANTAYVAAAKALNAQAAKSMDAVIDAKEVTSWSNSSRVELIQLSKTSPERLETRFKEMILDLIDTLRNHYPDFDTNMAALRDASIKYGLAEDTFIDTTATKPVLTFEYVDNRPVNQTSLSTFRLIFDKGAGKWTFTANGSFTIYNANQPPTNGVATSRLRDAEVGALAERKLGNLPLLGAAALDTAIYYQYQNAPAILKVDPATPLPGISFTGLPAGANTVFAQKGNIILGQIRLVLAPGSTSVRIPISFTGSNRTELIDKPTWRAQIGVSYDLDKLFSKSN